ncbi:MAG: hypothetical protein JST06_12170, partial [Bacteroidetes bacterium]|nr:hypothetical protein [Bacteroidota bacterium]
MNHSYSFDPQFVAPGTGYAIPFPAAVVFDYHLKLSSSASVVEDAQAAV